MHCLQQNFQHTASGADNPIFPGPLGKIHRLVCPLDSVGPGFANIKLGDTGAKRD
jgi:hypothetical protein